MATDIEQFVHALVRLADVVSALERVGYTYCESEHERVSASIGMLA